MAEKPILFNGDMVRAILEGRKTQTRRIIKPQPRIPTDIHDLEDGDVVIWRGAVCRMKSPRGMSRFSGELKAVDICPYTPGDVLWVRETWDYGYFERSDFDYEYSCWFESVDKDRAGDYVKAISRYIYRADFSLRDEAEYGMEDCHGNYKMTWRPSIHMPREAARIFLRVKDVRAERLLQITSRDAEAEGANPEMPLTFYHRIWDSMIKESDLPLYGWDANPWVWVVEFERLEPEGR